MAKSRVGTPRHVPPFLPQMPPTNGTGVGTGPIVLDAVGEKAVFTGRVRWADGASHDLRSVRWRTGLGTLVGTVEVSARDVDLANGPPVRDDGVADQAVSVVNPAASTTFTSTFTTDRAGVAQGALLAIVIEMTAFTSASCQPQFIATQSVVAQHGVPAVSSFLASAWAMLNGYPAITLIASDGTLGILAGGVPCPTSTSATVALNTGTTPDEVALHFTPTEPCWAGEIGVVASLAAGASFDAVLYDSDGTTPLATVSCDANAIDQTGINEFLLPFGDIALTAGQKYRVSIKPTTANSVTIYYWPVTSGDGELLGKGCGYSSRTDAGAWTDDATRFPMRVTLGLVAFDDGAGSGGGGGARSIHISAGIAA